MRISGPGKTDAPAPRKATGKKKSGSSGFTDALSAGDAAGAALASRAAQPVGPVAAVDALLALQEAPDAASGRSKGVARAEEMLALLEDVRRGILLGAIPRSKLRQLADLARRRREGFVDPALDSILDDIELRAEVELAKLESGE
ncbi:MAG: flagellar assembly protein FliX [Rhodothalassiaceae bacterium]